MSRTIIFFLETAIMLNLLLIALLNTQLSAAKSLSLSVKIVHSDSPASPVYPGNLTFIEKMQRYIESSNARASYLMSSISRHKKKNNNNSAVHPSAIIARPDVVYDHGAYLLKIGIGQPVTERWLHLDTGSDLTWIQCKPCVACYDQVDPIFDPANSSSFRKFVCLKDDTCRPAVCRGRLCFYQINYADESVSKGFLAREIFTFTNPEDLHFRMKFGCSSESKEGDSEETILGSWHQLDYRFIYDTGLRQLSFAAEDCSKDSP
ncbi:hypothetical protein Ddye_026892 [Dipteronia dyeriana]|uniref:Peptidase A1 domain-containing protein n=1 Tax=Dipteronia dyeriana TaxID=168575 RepID=A0AAD9TN15_9ROSI|nr:hypothetical protein Ddye_026892 [Dipteronia dyeriana]